MRERKNRRRAERFLKKGTITKQEQFLLTELKTLTVHSKTLSRVRYGKTKMITKLMAKLQS